jgi:membrane protease YdiL (CAAX protease family)
MNQRQSAVNNGSGHDVDQIGNIRSTERSIPSSLDLVLASATYVLVLLVLWSTTHLYDIEQRIGRHVFSTFLSFALLLAPLWTFGFGVGDLLADKLSSMMLRVLLPGLLVIPYLVLSIPRGEFHIPMATGLFALPIVMAACLEIARRVDTTVDRLPWRDLLVLAIVGFIIQFRLWERLAAEPGIDALAELLLLDATLYSFLVVRRLPRIGYDFRPRTRDVAVGTRELAFFAPLGIALGLSLRFSQFHPGLPSAAKLAGDLIVILLFMAIPQELLFRGLLQNVLEKGLGRNRALMVTAVVFGLSHFNQGMAFNWRFVLLATFAGIFYGRAWRDRCRLLPATLTHGAVNLVWILWFQ